MSEADTVIGGRYRLVRRIGRGGMGEVWLAQDELLDRQVAIKRLLTGDGPTEPAGPEDLSKLLREARLAARLNHPNAVSVFDVVVEPGSGRRPDVVMEYVPGDTLADKIKRRGRIPGEEVRRIGAAIADALAEAHRLGIVHRDLKPANIMVTDRGVPKLADFGIARLGGEASSGNTVTGFMLGTPAFLAPEVARGGNADAASDVWSLGITLYAALDGHSPFQTSSQDNTLAILSRVVTSAAPPPQHGGELTPVIMRMIASDPRARPLAHEAAHLLRSPGESSWSGAGAPGPTGAGSATLPRHAAAHTPSSPSYGAQGPPTPTPGPHTPPPLTPPPHTSSPYPPAPYPQTPGGSPYSAPPPYAPQPAPTGGRGQWSSGPPPQYPQGPPSQPIPHGGASPKNRRRVLLVSGAAVVLLAGGTVGIVAATAGGGSPSAQGHSSGASSPSGSGGGADTSGFPNSSTAAPTSLPPTASGAPSLGADEQVYRGPGGIAVAAPSSWTPDDSAGIAAVRDYRAPGAADIKVGSYFRIGIGNTSPAANIHGEVAGTEKSLKSSQSAYRKVKILRVTYIKSYQGTEAADIEFTGTNSSDIARQVILRLWIEHGHTLEIELNSSPTLFAGYIDYVYKRMVESCIVTG